MARTLSEHAAYELTKAGLSNSDDPQARKIASDLMALVHKFDKQKHTEKSHAFMMEALPRLLSFIPLTPITDDPDEWDKFEIERKNVDTGEIEKKTVWQSKRSASIFSEDEGKTWVDQRTGKTDTSLDHQAEAKRLVEEEAVRADRKAEAVARNSRPVGHIDPTPPNEQAAGDES
jgi:hypothetical protein